MLASDCYTNALWFAKKGWYTAATDILTNYFLIAVQVWQKVISCNIYTDTLFSIFFIYEINSIFRSTDSIIYNFLLVGFVLHVYWCFFFKIAITMQHFTNMYSISSDLNLSSLMSSTHPQKPTELLQFLTNVNKCRSPQKPYQQRKNESMTICESGVQKKTSFQTFSLRQQKSALLPFPPWTDGQETILLL